MKILPYLQVVWKKDSFYMKTAVKNTAAGFIAGYIFSIISRLHGIDSSMQEFSIKI